MKLQDARVSGTKLSNQRGIMLLETMIALAILIIVAVGLMSMSLTAIATTENQGHLAARTAEYAQDKMEQLMSLAYSDSSTDTSFFPACGPSSTPACNNGTGLAVGGSSTPGSPSTGYVDYLDISGNPLTFTGTTAPGGWFYIRVWQISTPSGTTNLKQVTVTAQTRSDVGPSGALPTSTVVSYKSSPF
ncbi:MAG TPA: type II secretion system protein [Candidatus Acidoferrales bacterium]|nr:type II secretion system protein [Candidatus Acidoferrales bacterium]